MENFACISINYKNCGEDIRGSFMPQESKCVEFIAHHAECSPVVLRTCSRTELYIMGTPDEAVEYFAKLSSASTGTVRKLSMQFNAEKAIRHLFKVASGIDSVIVGEDEVLGQVKKAYALSANTIHLCEKTNVIFQSAIACAKRIKTDTALSRTSVSYATLSAKMAAHFTDKPTVMLIGASGDTGGSLLKNLLSYQKINVLATMRSHNGSVIFPNSPSLKIIEYNKRYDYIPKCDCIISATSSPHTIIFADKIISPEKPQLFIDLAVPRDIDPQIGEISGITLRSIDYFKELVNGNGKLKRSSIKQAESIIDEDIDELKKALIMHDFQPFLQKNDFFSDMSAKEFLYKLRRELDCDSFAAVVHAAERISGGE